MRQGLTVGMAGTPTGRCRGVSVEEGWQRSEPRLGRKIGEEAGLTM